MHQRQLRTGRLGQGLLPFRPGRGGKRAGAGRRPAGRKAGVAHATRAPLPRHCPAHVTLRLLEGLPSLRRIDVETELRDVFCAMKERSDFKIVHYSIQQNHLHFIVEAGGKEALSRGMQALCIRIAKRLNRIWQRRGTIFKDRYHAQILRTPRQVRNAIVYVLTNAWKHGCRIKAALDRFASGWCFDGFRENVTVRNADHVERPVEPPGTWLLRKGWRKHGLIRVEERARIALT